MFEIRRVRADEWRELRALRLESLQDSPTAFWRRYDEDLRTTEAEWRAWTASACFAAVDEGRFVGMVVGMPDDEQDDLADLYAMYVTPSARGRGVGEALVQQHLEWARQAGFRRVRLLVNVRNNGAIRLYERCGFRDTGAREPLRDGPETLLEMVAAL